MTTTPPDFSTTTHVTEQLSKWPKVLAIASIALGIGGALAGFCGLVGALFTSAIAGFAERYPTAGGASGSTEASMAAMTQYQGWVIAQSVLSALLAGLLIFAGVRLLNRRAQCRQLIRLWAVMKIVLATCSAVLTYLIQEGTFAALAAQTAAAGESGSGAPASAVSPMPVEFMQSLQYVGLSATFLWGCALACFMLIWFNRSKIKAEVEAWA